MTTEVKSTNEVVQAIVSGSAPAPARLAAARGMLPLPQADLLEALVHLRSDDDEKIAQAAQSTLDEQTPEELLSIAKSREAAPMVLGYFASLRDASREFHEAVATHANPDSIAVRTVGNQLARAATGFLIFDRAGALAHGRAAGGAARGRCLHKPAAIDNGKASRLRKKNVMSHSACA